VCRVLGGEDLSYCSRVCCGQALKNAIRLKAEQPSSQITILYRDMRAYGFMEDDYRRARQQGVIFSRYEVDNKPEVKLEGQDQSLAGYLILIRFFGESMELATDLLVFVNGHCSGRSHRVGPDAQGAGHG